MKKLLIIAAIATIFASCTKEEPLTISTPTKFTMFGIYQIENSTGQVKIQAIGNGPSHYMAFGTKLTDDRIQPDMGFRIEPLDSYSLNSYDIRSNLFMGLCEFSDTSYTKPTLKRVTKNNVEILRLTRIQ
jgi:hypothetical protein